MRVTVDSDKCQGHNRCYALAPDVFDEVRNRAESPALIINHPRAGGVRQGYFTETGYDPVTGSVARPEHWDEDFTIIEVFNSTDFESTRESTVVDWFSLLNSGRRVFAVGSSDSHDVRSAPVGYPRTCLRVGVDDHRPLSRPGRARATGRAPPARTPARRRDTRRARWPAATGPAATRSTP